MSGNFTKLGRKTLTSIVSYESRDEEGKIYGDPRWWGNTSGRLIKDLLLHYIQHHFRRTDIVVVDPMSGSGTTYDVCMELGIENVDCYDLNDQPRVGVGGWNVRRDEFGRAADFIFSHPPYWDIVRYSRDVWPSRTPNPDDLSEIQDYWEFIRALNEAHLRMFADLKPGGLMAVLTADVRKRGEYFPISKHLADFGKVKAIIIKRQNNVRSDRKAYRNINFIPIVHEHLIVYEKPPGTVVQIKKTVLVDFDLMKWSNTTWKSLVRAAMEKLGRQATLSSLYKMLESTPKARRNANWKARIRATLQESPDFEPLGNGVWRLAS